jgi:hypothetical protein
MKRRAKMELFEQIRREYEFGVRTIKGGVSTALRPLRWRGRRRLTRIAARFVASARSRATGHVCAGYCTTPPWPQCAAIQCSSPFICACRRR